MLKTGFWMVLCLVQLGYGQPNTRIFDVNKHVWSSYSGDHPVSGRWGIHFDGQWRRSDLGTEWQQYQLRPGLNYSLSRAVLLTLGYAFTKTYPYGDFPVRTSIPEHRIYQQAVITHSWRSLRLQHRPRLEQRFIRYPDQQPRSRTYQNRFRYLFRVEVPLFSGSNGTSLWYMPVSNEILVGIAPNYGARPFDQNRVFLGVGRTLPGARVEAGFMNQFIGQRNGRIFESNNTLLVAVTSNVPITSLWREQAPTMPFHRLGSLVTRFLTR
ncbi:MAG TPA: DUF2490 domain-containing protein [Bryobacteraceae bacterium]|nr:DUF2490 domain-containing protein [Bryobacteraceae bacterium]